MADCTSKIFEKNEAVTVKSFCDLHQVTQQAVNYAMKEGIIDYIVIGRYHYPLMTDLTKKYTPNQSRKRRRAVVSLIG